MKAGSETPVRRLSADFSASRLACVALAVATTVLLLALLAVSSYAGLCCSGRHIQPLGRRLIR